MGPMSIFNATGCRSIADTIDSTQEHLEGKAAAGEHGFFRKFIGGGNSPSEASDAAAAFPKKDKRSFSGASKSSAKKMMDVLGPLLLSKGKALNASKPSLGSGMPATGALGAQACLDPKHVLNRSMSANSGLTEYVNKMHLAESLPGITAGTKRHHAKAAAPATVLDATAAPRAAAAAAAPAPAAAPQPPAAAHRSPQLSSLERLLEQARHCNLPVSPRGPDTSVLPAASAAAVAAGAASRPEACVAPTCPTVMLSMSATVPPRMHRSKWSLDDYIINEKLYTGYASTVYKATCLRSGDIVVLKIYTLSAVCDLYKYQIYREIRVHSQLQHENIVHLYASFQQGEKVVLVQEYADGSDLFNLLHKYGGRLSERLAVQMVLEPFLRVLQYLHTRGIIHRDIKPENIMFTKNMCLKLGDFGLAIDLREERAVTRAGTLDYMAPEVLRCPFKSRPTENKENIRLHYSNRVDSWAVGVLTYELVVGFPPFFDQSRSGTEDRIMTSVPGFPANMSEEAKAFVCASLSKSPAERPTILELLNHTWVDSYRTRRSMRNMAQFAPPSSAHASGAGGATGAVQVLSKSSSSSRTPGAAAAATLRSAAAAPLALPAMPMHSSLRAAAALPTGLSSILSNISDDARGSAAVKTSNSSSAHHPHHLPSHQHPSSNSSNTALNSTFQKRASPDSALHMENSNSSVSSDGSVYMSSSHAAARHNEKAALPVVGLSTRAAAAHAVAVQSVLC